MNGISERPQVIASNGEPAFVRRAKGLLGMIPINEIVVDKQLEHAQNFPLELDLDPDKNRLQRLKWWKKESLPTALIGSIEDLGTNFRIQDGIIEMVGQTVPWQNLANRLDLATLIHTSSAMNYLDAISVTGTGHERSSVILATKPGVMVAKFNFSSRTPRLELEDAKHLQRLHLERGEDEAMRTFVNPMVENHKTKRLSEWQEDHPEETKEKEPYKSNLRMMQLTNDQIYTFFIRHLLIGARDGEIIEGNSLHKIENTIWFSEKEEFDLTPKIKVLMTTGALLCKAREGLVDDNYRDPFGDPVPLPENPTYMDLAISELVKAISLLHARLPFAIDLDRITDGQARQLILGRTI